jgi:hypothetical protein
MAMTTAMTAGIGKLRISPRPSAKKPGASLIGIE